jgi:hypothetical protein
MQAAFVHRLTRLFAAMPRSYDRAKAWRTAIGPSPVPLIGGAILLIRKTWHFTRVVMITSSHYTCKLFFKAFNSIRPDAPINCTAIRSDNVGLETSIILVDSSSRLQL